MKMNKILIVGLIICSCQFANASIINNNIDEHNNNKYFNINAIDDKPKLIQNKKNNINNNYKSTQYGKQPSQFADVYKFGNEHEISMQFVDKDNENNNQNIINIDEQNNNQYFVNINVIDNEPRLIQKKEDDISNYHIPTHYELPIQRDELMAFINNIRQNPTLLLNAQRILSNSIDKKDFVKCIVDYMQKLLNYDYTNLVQYYDQEINNIANNLNNGYNNSPYYQDYFYNTQRIALINEWFYNIISGTNYQQYIPDRYNIFNYTDNITCTIIIKMIRTINLISDLNQQTLDTIHDIKHKNNVLTFLNSNGKCAFVSTFQLFVTAFNTSEPGDKIRKTNFAKFINYLHRKKNDLAPENRNNKNKDVSKYYFSDEVTSNRYRYYDYGILFNPKNKKSTKHNFGLSQWTPKLRKDYLSNSNKSNIDLFSELILWCSNNEGWYNINDNKYNIPEKDQKINDITSEEAERRKEALKLIAESRDIFDGYFPQTVILVILHLFPELKHFFGSKTINGIDMLANQIDKNSIDNDKMKSINIANNTTTLQNQINNLDIQIKDIEIKINEASQQINNLEVEKTNNSHNLEKYTEISNNQNNLKSQISNYLTQLNQLKSDKKLKEKPLKEEDKIFPNLNLSSFNNFDKNYLNNSELLDNFSRNIVTISDFITLLSSRDYLFIEATDPIGYYYNINNLVKGYKYITKFNMNGTLEIYELSGIQLGDGGHATAFVKNNSANNSSWNAIDDSSGRFNDNNCKLTDIIYIDNGTYQYYNNPLNKMQNRKITGLQQDKSNNTYVAKVCKHFRCVPKLLLYKKVSLSELPSDIQSKIKDYKKYNHQNNNLQNINNRKYPQINNQQQNVNNDIYKQINNQ